MSNTIQIKRRTSGSGTLASLLEGELGVDLTDSNKLYVGTSGGNQLLNPSASTNYLPLTGGTLTGNLNANGLEAGVWSGNASFRGIFHSAHTGTEYCLISNDTNTILSASTGYGVFIRGGNNVSTYQIGVYHNQLPTAGGNTILTTASGLQLSGGTLTNTSQPVLKTAYNADHYLGIGHHYIDLNFSSYTNDLELRTGGTPRLTIHRSTGNATFSGTITATGGDLTGTLNIGNTGDEKIVLKNSNNPYVMFQQGTTNKGYIQWNAAYAFLEIANSAESTNLRLDDTLQLSLDGGSYYDVLTSNTGLLKTGGTLTGDLEVQTASGGELLIDRNGNSGVLLQQKNNGADNSGTLKIQSGTSTIFTSGGTDILTLTSTGGTLTGELTSRKVAPSANNTYSSGGANYRWSNVFSVGGNFTGDLTLNGNFGANSTSALSTWTGRLKFDTDYSDTARGPNKVEIYNDGSAWVAGLGVHTNTVAFYSGNQFAWYKSNSQTGFVERMRIDSDGALLINTTSKGSSTGKLYAGSPYTASSAIAQFNGFLRFGFGITHDATRGINPNVTGQGSIGLDGNRYGKGFFNRLDIGAANAGEQTSFGDLVVKQQGDTNADGFAVVGTSNSGNSSLRLWVDSGGNRKINAGTTEVFSFTTSAISLLQPVSIGQSSAPSGNNKLEVYNTSGNYNAVLKNSGQATLEVQGGENSSARIRLIPDEGDDVDNADHFQLIHETSNNFELQRYVVGSGWEWKWKLDSSNNVHQTGNLTVGGSLYLTDTNTRLHEGSGNSLRITTNSGYVDIGPMNSSYSHFQTDRGKFYFNKELEIDGRVIPYTNNTYTLGTNGYRWSTIYGSAGDFSGRLTVSDTSGADGLVIAGGENTGISARLFFETGTSGQGISILNVGGSFQFRTGATAGSSSGVNRLHMSTGGTLYPEANDTTLGLTTKRWQLRATSGDFSGNVTVGGYARSENITYAANQDVAYLIAGTSGWTGATTNWNTYGFQHRIKTNSGGVPRVTIDRAGGEAFSVDNSSNVAVGNNLTVGGNLTVTGTISAGSNADTLDNLDSTQFLRSDASDTASGDTYTFSSSSTAIRMSFTGHAGAANYNYFINAYNDGGLKAVHFVNGSTRTADGGANAYTIRNDGGKLILGRSDQITNILGSAVTVGGDLGLADNKKLKLGDSNDLQIFHDGSHSYIKDTGTGSLYIQGGPSVQIENASGANMAVFTSGGAAELYHNNSKKFETLSNGAKVTQYLYGSDGEILAGQDSGGYYYATGASPSINKPVFIGDNASYIRMNVGTAERFRATTTGATVTGNLTASGTANLHNGSAIDSDMPLVVGNASSPFQTVAQFGSSGGGIFITTSAAHISSGVYYNGAWLGTSTNSTLLNFSGGQFQFQIGSGTVGGTHTRNTKFTVNSTGAAVTGSLTTTASLGVGTASPSAKLNVLENANDWTAIIKNTHAHGYGLSVDCIANTNGTVYALGVYTGVGTGFFVKNSGLCGIGVAQPSTKLDVYHATDSQITVSSNSDSSGDSSLALIERSADSAFGSANTYGFQWKYDGGDNKLYLTSGNQTSIINRLTVERDTGNVGIGGVTSPSAKLDVAGAIKANNNLTISGSSSVIDLENTSGGTQVGRITFDQTGQNKLVISTHYQSSTDLNLIQFAPANNVAMTVRGGTGAYDGFVGIGTENPTRLLHVNGGSTNFVAEFESTDDKASILIKDDTTLNYIHSRNGYFSLGGASDAGATNLTINSSTGHVGIGTTSPSGKLHVNGSDDFLAYFKSSDNKAYIAIADDDTTGYISAENGLLSIGANTGAHASNLNADIGTGNVGIGTTSPTYPLHISSSNNVLAQFHSTDANATIYLSDNGTTNLSAFKRISDNLAILENGGNVGIGTTSPVSWAKLHVAGDIHSTNIINTDDYFRVRSGGVTKVIIDGNGDSYFNGGNVGIGTESPSTKLDIQGGSGAYGLVLGPQVGSTTFSGRLYLEGSTATNAILRYGSYLAFTTGATKGSASGTVRMAVMDDGDVGINTVSPSEKLHVAGNVRASQYLTTTGNNRTKIKFWGTSTHYGIGMYEGMTYGGLNDYAMTFQFNSEADRGFWWGDSTHTNAQGAMALTTEGKLTVAHSMRLGFGESDTSTPGSAARLDIASNDGTDHTDSTPDTLLRLRKKFLSSSDKDSAVNFDVSRYITGGNNRPRTRLDFVLSGDVGDTYDNSEPNVNVLSLRSDGRCGIGTTSPSVSLDIVSTDAAPIKLYRNSGNCSVHIKNSGDDVYVGVNTYNNVCLGHNLDQTTAPFQLTSSGSLGLGTASADAKLHISNSASSGGTFKFTDGSSRTLMDLGGGILSWNAGSVMGAGSWAGTADHQFQTLTTSRNTVQINGPASGTNHALYVTGLQSYFSGSVGINCTPTQKLDVNGQSRLAGKVTAVTSEVAITSGGGYTTHLNYNNTGSHYISTGNSGFTLFRGSSNGVNAMQVNGDGKVSINSSSNNGYNLHVTGTSFFSDDISLGGNDTSRSEKLKFHDTGGEEWYVEYNDGLRFVETGNAERFKLLDGGNIDTPDQDKYAQFGRARVGYVGHNDYAGFAHRDHSNGTSYGFLQGYQGATFINSAAGQTIYFRQNNANVGGIVSGNWGLGTISPGSYKLYVNGQTYSNASLTVNGNIHFETTGQYITFYGDNSRNHAIAANNSSGNAADDLRINTYGALFINLDSNGNDSLESHSSFQIGRHGGTGSISDWLLDLSGETGQLQLSKYGGSGLTGTVAKYLAVDSSGNVIQADGTGSGGGSGTVNSGTAEQMAFYASSGTAVSGTSAFTFENSTDQEFNIGDGSSKGELCIGGGVGATSATYRLFVNGSIKATALYDKSTTAHYIAPSQSGISSQVEGGYAMANGGGSYNTGYGVIYANSSSMPYWYDGSGNNYSIYVSSDYRLKSNVEAWDSSTASSLVKGLNVYSFDWNEKGQDLAVTNDTSRIGFLAHEVKDKIPHNRLVAVDKDATDENGEPIYQTVDQAGMVPILWAALQDALKRIEQLEAR